MQRITLLLLLATVAGACTSAQKFSLTIPAQDRVELNYAQYDRYKASIKNQTKEGIDVAVIDKDDRQISGFGLGPNSRSDITVSGNNTLVLQNTSERNIKFKIKVEEFTPEPLAYNQDESVDHVSFTLQNKSAKSIPLLIPTVMNPNLSPFSKSGVKLEIGQEILFREKGRKYVLLTVDQSISNGDIVEVAALLKQRKQELGL